ncbi:MAG: restriction endonuclease [Thiolinea sp.]
MAIPKHDAIRIEALKLLNQYESLKLKEFEQPLAIVFSLTEEEVAQGYESGNGRIFNDRISWALSYLNMAGLVEKPKRGVYKIGQTGIEQLQTPESLNTYVAEQIKIYQVAKKKQSDASDKLPQHASAELTPTEELYNSAAKIRNSIYEELLDTILSKSPREFEKLVVMLLQKMGYGGEVKSAAKVTSYTNDKGIDGIIKEDVLGLGRIHIQAKRYARNNTVNREEIQKFVGALAVAQSNKGVFITTSSYSKGAVEYAESLNGATTLVLIDGGELAAYFYEYGLGMQVKHTIEIKELDSDFWNELADE